MPTDPHEDRRDTGATRCAIRRTGGCRASRSRARWSSSASPATWPARSCIPAIYDLANRGMLPPSFVVLGFARRDWGDGDFEALAKEAAQEHARTPWRDEVWARLAGNIKFVGGSFDDDDGVRPARRDAGRAARHATASRATPRSTCPSRRPRSRSCSSSWPAPGWPTTRSPAAGAGSWWRSRSATTSTSAKRAQRPGRRRVHRAGRVPHRPLPRQGDGPEHPRAALRQHAVRAAVELASTSTRCRSPWPRTSASAPGPASTTPPAPPATCCRTTCMQLLAMVAMEEPTSFDAAEIRAEKLKVLRADHAAGRHRRPAPSAASTCPAGWPASARVGYLEEEDVPADSTTETYVAVRLGIQNRRWAGVPFYIRAGKRMPRRVTEIAVHVQARAAPAVPTGRRGVARPQPAGRPGPAGRGRDAQVRLEGARHHDGAARHRDGLPVRRGVHRLVPGGVRAADPGRPDRRPDAVPGRGRGRGELAGRRPAGGGLGGHEAGAVPRRRVGPARGRRDARPRRARSAGGAHDRRCGTPPATRWSRRCPRSGAAPAAWPAASR